MDLRKFSRQNRERCESPEGFNHPLNSWSTSDWFTAVMGELGEAANVAKKLNRVRDGIPGNKESLLELHVKLRAELADTFLYLDLLTQSLGVELSDIVPVAFRCKSAEIGYVRPSRDLAAPGEVGPNNCYPDPSELGSATCWAFKDVSF